MVQKHINRFGFTARAHLDLAQKLTEGRERFDRVILDKKIESRERYMKMLPRLCQQLENLAEAITQEYVQVRDGSARTLSARAKAFERSLSGLQRLYPRFYFKQKVTEEFVHLADQHFAKMAAANSDSSRSRLRNAVAPHVEELERAAW